VGHTKNQHTLPFGFSRFTLRVNRPNRSGHDFPRKHSSGVNFAEIYFLPTAFSFGAVKTDETVGERGFHGIARFKKISPKGCWVTWRPKPLPSIALAKVFHYLQMKSRASSKFWKAYKEQLPQDIQRIAVKQYRLWVRDSSQFSLQFKKIHSYWSCRITDSMGCGSNFLGLCNFHKLF
jgi:hypothetical protein